MIIHMLASSTAAIANSMRGRMIVTNNRNHLELVNSIFIRPSQRYDEADMNLANGKHS